MSERLAIKLETITSDPKIPKEDKTEIRPLVDRFVEKGRLTPEQAAKILAPIQEESSNSPLDQPYFELMQQVNGQMVREFFPPN